MAIKESLLQALQIIELQDYVRAVTSAGESRRVSVSDLAKTIIENYQVPSLAGENQSVADAIDGIASAIGASTDWAAVGNFITYKRKNGVVCVRISTRDATALNRQGVILGTLPEGFRPSMQLDFGGTSLGGTETVFFRIEASGTVIGFSNPNTTYWDGTCTFLA